VTYLLPAAAIILGVIVLNESFTVLIAAGIVLVLIGVAVTRAREPTSAADRARVNQRSSNR
jgi:drug/metabolite transporter (DMT)-like permease